MNLFSGSDITLEDFANSPDVRSRLKKSLSGTFVKTEEVEDWAAADEDELVQGLSGAVMIFCCVL
jgi:hypothetical protein